MIYALDCCADRLGSMLCSPVGPCFHVSCLGMKEFGYPACY